MAKNNATIIKGRLLAGIGNTMPMTLEAINKGWKPAKGKAVNDG